MADLKIKELHKILGELIADGQGDKKFEIFYDSETVYTSIPKKSRILMFSHSIRFTDYEEEYKPKDHLIEGILEKLDDADDVIINKKLLEKIRHDLVSIGGLKAFDSLGDNVKSNDSHVNVLISELIPLNFEELIKEIDEVLE